MLLNVSRALGKCKLLRRPGRMRGQKRVEKHRALLLIG
jgi:hypothetical protein